MRDEASIRQPQGLRLGLLAWMLVTLLIVLLGLNPHAAAASTMQLHGALRRDGPVGIISHRGAAAVAPENTLAAMSVAIDQDVEFVETDVRLTSDGVPILMHDPELDRTTSGSGPVSERTFAEIRSLDAGSWFSPDFVGEPVPTLEEFLDLLAPSTTRALIELKGEWTPEQMEVVIDLLRSRYMVNRVALESFELPTLEELQRIAPEFARVLLTREWDEGTVQEAVALQVSAVGARTRLYEARPELLERLRAAGIGALVYTLNTEKRWEEAQERGVDLVITDDPVSLAAWRDGA
ncbi:MAG: glycerophosphodiester phosphodiesterase family protein [Leucobacter sp.]